MEETAIHMTASVTAETPTATTEPTPTDPATPTETDEWYFDCNASLSVDPAMQDGAIAPRTRPTDG
ncbi:hypothetical protein C9J85_18445 [Haloferax sp. wsp5]|nr:hypothetical protein C9J85_18445 [Haloferax sp. wsp5]